MELTVGYLKKVLAKLDDDVILADLRFGNEVEPFMGVKRLLVVECSDRKMGWGGRKFLVINNMGTHWSKETEKQNRLKYADVWFDEDTDFETNEK